MIEVSLFKEDLAWPMYLTSQRRLNCSPILHELFFLNALMEVDGLPASALAQQAGITLQTASSHLHQLVEGQLIKVEQHGRHKYYRLASVEVAQVIEALSALAPKPAVHSFNSYSASQKLRKGRSCYDHLAGALGVTLTDYFVNQGYLIESNDLNYEVTFEGMVFFH